MCDLIHMDTIEAEFTWSNGRHSRGHTVIRLDKTLCNAEWYSVWSETCCKTLIKEFSNHYPFLLSFDIYARVYPTSFSFMPCWIQNDSFLDDVRECWSVPTPNVDPMVRMMIKQKR